MANSDSQKIAALRQTTDRLKVFISYSRHDSRFASEILGGLEYDGGFETLIDSHSIYEGEEWKARISSLIAECGTFIVILSPNWANSAICQWELDEAWRHSKRVVPVQATSLNGVSVPPRLAAINYVRFDESPDGTPRLFMDGMSAIRRVLITDLGWVREHARLLSKAAEWEAAGRVANRMLSGSDISTAKHWLETWPAGAPPPTELQRDYIAASQKAEAQLLSAERRRAEALQRAYNRARTALMTASVAALVAAGAGLFAYAKKLDAQRSATRAAEERDAALLVQSRHLNDIAARRIEAGAAHTAMLLALSGLPDPDARETARRPYLPELEGRLYESMFDNREQSLLPGHEAAVLDAAISADGKRIVTGSSDQWMRLWDAATGRETQRVKCESGPISAVAFTPDAARVVRACGTKAEVVDAQSGKILLELTDHTDEVVAVALSADGTHIVTGSDDHTARIWEANSGKLIANLVGHAGPISSVAISRDGSFVLTASRDATAMIWEVTAPAAPKAVFKEHALALSGIALSGDGRIAVTASTDKSIRLFEATTGKPVASPIQTEEPPTALAITFDGKRIVSGQSDGTVKVWDAASGALQLTVLGHAASITHVAFSGDGGRVLSSARDGTARVWQLSPTAEAPSGDARIEAISSVSVSSDGKRLVVAGKDKRAHVWRAGLQAPPVLVGGDDQEVTEAAISRDGSKVLAGGPDGRAYIWDTAAAKVLGHLDGHSGPVSSVALSPDGLRAATGSEDTTARVWEVETGRAISILKPHVARVTSIAFSANADRVLTGSGTSARLWDVDTGEQVAAFLSHTGSVLAVALSPRADLAASGGRDGSVRLWRIADAKQVHQLLVAGRSATSVAFSSDGSRIMSGWNDGQLRIWQVSTGALIASTKLHDATIAGLSVAAGTGQVVTGGSDGSVRMSTLFADTDSLVRQARLRAVRCLSPEERLTYHLPETPPRWCITGASKEAEHDPANWQPLWPYNSEDWRRWLIATDRGEKLHAPKS